MVYKRRLFYFPGMISLIGLFILLSQSKERFEEKKTYTLDLNVPKIDYHNSWYIDPFTEKSIYNLFRNKVKINVTLDGNPINSQNKLDFIRLEARRLKYTRDTSKVVLVEFTDQTRYEEIVRLIDLCFADQHERFSLLKNSFVIFGEYPPPKKDTSEYVPFLMCGTGEIMQENYRLKKMKEEHRKRLMIHFRKESLYLYAGWILLLTSFFYFRKK